MSLEYDLRVFFDGRTEPNRDWSTSSVYQFPHRFIGSLQIPYWRKRPDNIPGERRYRQISYSLVSALKQFRPDIVITGELGMRSLQASVYCKLAGIPMILWWEGTPHTEGWASYITTRFRSLLVRQATRFWANGKESAGLLTAYGASPSQIDEGMIGVDTRSLIQQIEQRSAMRDMLRANLGINGTVFLFVGRFVKPKGLLPLLNSIELLKQNTVAEFSVLMVGGGPEQPMLESWQAKHPDIVTRIFAFQGSEVLADFYAASDVFVMPTLDDNWSLVALEAAVAGLPQILSQFNGASSDLLERGVEGVCIDPLDTKQFARTLQTYAEHQPGRAHHQCQASFAEHFSSEALAQRACRSIELACLSHQ